MTPGHRQGRTIHMHPPRPHVVGYPGRVSKPEGWSFVMVAASVETISTFLHEIRSGPRALSTLAVYLALAPYVRRDTGEVACIVSESSPRPQASRKATFPGLLIDWWRWECSSVRDVDSTV